MIAIPKQQAIIESSDMTFTAYITPGELWIYDYDLNHDLYCLAQGSIAMQLTPQEFDKYFMKKEKANERNKI